LSTHSSVSFILYIKRIEVQNNNLSWTDQVDEYNNLQEFFLFYTSPKVGDDNTNNEATRLANMPNLHEEDINNTNTNTYIP